MGGCGQQATGGPAATRRGRWEDAARFRWRRRLARHLLAAFDHGVVLAQVDVHAKANEGSQLPVHLDTLEVVGLVITADALHAQRPTADYLHRRGAHDVLTVKRNQLNLYAQLTALPWAAVPVADRTRDRGHGRATTCTVKVTAVRAGILFPHAPKPSRSAPPLDPHRPVAHRDRLRCHLPGRRTG